MPSNVRQAVCLLATTTLSLSLVQCNGDTTEVVCLSDLSTTDAGRKVQAFIDTSNVLILAAKKIDSDMLNVCKSMARDLGIPAASLEPAPGNGTLAVAAETDAACRRVRLEIDQIVREHLVANSRLAVVYTPSVCRVNAGARLMCEQQCDPKTITVTRLECTPGHAYVQCKATCTGKCTGSCEGTCAGSCAGSCSGTCSGNCNGACAGTCAARNADGSCYGACTGTCMGVCDGSCTGNCIGTCSGSCSAICSGACEGDCSVSVMAPECTQVQQVTMVEECKTNCDARAHFEAACTEPSLTVSYGYAANLAHKAALDRLVLTLQNNYSELLRISAQASLVVVDAAGGYLTALRAVASTAQQVGLGATACVADAVRQVTTSAAKVQVSVNVSIAISASLSTMGGLAPM